MSQSEMGFRTAPFGFRREDVLDFIEDEADRRNALEEKLQQAEEERARLAQEKEDADRAAQALIADRDRILAEEQAKDQTITSLKAKVRAAQEQAGQAQKQLTALREQMDETQKALDSVRADDASLLSKCAEYDEARARLAEIELCAHGRAEEIQQRAEQDACSLVEEAEQMAERLISAIENTKEAYRQAIAAAERERAHADSQAAEALAQFDEIMTGLRGRLSHAIETPAEQDPTAPKPHETPAKPAEHPAQTVEKHKPACQGREKPTLAQLLGALRGNK